MVTGIVFYVLAITLLAFSFFTDMAKTGKALRKAWKSLESILPQFLGIIVLIGIVLAVFDPNTVQRLIGSSSEAKEWIEKAIRQSPDDAGSGHI